MNMFCQKLVWMLSYLQMFTIVPNVPCIEKGLEALVHSQNILELLNFDLNLLILFFTLKILIMIKILVTLRSGIRIRIFLISVILLIMSLFLGINFNQSNFTTTVAKSQYVL